MVSAIIIEILEKAANFPRSVGVDVILGCSVEGIIVDYVRSNSWEYDCSGKDPEDIIKLLDALLTVETF